MVTFADRSVSEAMSEADIDYSEEFEASGAHDVTATAQSMRTSDKGVTSSVAEKVARSSGMLNLVARLQLVTNYW